MNEFDDFCNSLFDEAKRFHEKSREIVMVNKKTPYKHASLLLAICALEAFVNGIAEELVSGGHLALHEAALLSEKEIQLKNGKYTLGNSLKMQKLIDRIEFIIVKHSKKPIDKQNSVWWSGLTNGISLRNDLVHPKQDLVISESQMINILESVLECINELYLSVYKRKFPSYSYGLTSKLDF